jgi:glutamine synthetase
MLAAALDGIKNKLECPDPLNDVNIYELSLREREEMGIAALPGSLSEALRELEADPVIQDALGPEAYAAFLRAKQSEVEGYKTTVTDWEVERYLQTA